MADIICVRCGEPWDHDELHFTAEDDGTTYREVLEAFAAFGCEALHGKCNEDAGPAGRARGKLFAALLEIGGDDVDGAIAEFEDFVGMGW